MFVENFPLGKIVPAQYNPREITEASFEALKKSILKYGICKPVILNKNGTIVAGHQRTKAMSELGLEYTPAFILNSNIKTNEEIRFNMFHNSLETEESKIKIDVKDIQQGFQFIEPEQIIIEEKGDSIKNWEICNLINKYGDFGCLVVDQNGKVLHNSDYGFCCKLLNRKLLIYMLKNSEGFSEIIKKDYGKYSYKNLNIKSYNQTHCQMCRNGETIHSRLYENYVIPNISKEHRILDFGAGQCFYINRLKKEGFMAHCYEPFFNGNNGKKLDIGRVKEMISDLETDIKQNGLFDVVILDSVINSVVNDDFEKNVLISCNSLLKENGVFYVATRCNGRVNRKMSKMTYHTKYIEFLDDNNYSISFRKGVFTVQKFHSENSLRKLLEKYFEEIEIEKTTDKKMMFAVCRKPLRVKQEEIQEALNIEFNMEYPNGLFLNVHKKLVENILRENCEKYER